MNEYEDLKSEYLESLIAYTEALQASLEEYKENGNLDSLKSIDRIVHKLKGSGGIFGFSNISERARAVQQTMSDDGGIDDEVFFQAFNQLFDTLYDVTGTEGGYLAKILIVDDDPQIRKLLQRYLEGTHRELLFAENGKEALEILKKQNVSLVLLDLTLPDMDGRSILETIRENESTKSIPVIVLTGLVGPAPKTECFAFGADMYFEKPFDFHALSAAVSARLKYSSRLSREVGCDLLTGLPSRATFKESFRWALNVAESVQQPLGLGLLDLTNIQEWLTHENRDELYLHAVSVISQSLPGSSCLSPWGGEELAIFFQHEDLDAGVEGLRKAEEAFQKRPYVNEAGEKFYIRFQCGLALIENQMTFMEAMSRADDLLFLSKRSKEKALVTWQDTDLNVTPIEVLLVGNERDFSGDVAEGLNREHVNITHVSDGYQAMEVLSAQYSAVVLDIDVPGTDGIEVLKKIKADTRLKKLPVILVTSQDQKGQIDQGMSLGVCDYAIKPVHPIELTSRIYRHVQLN